MSMGITIDINGHVIERIVVQQTTKLDTDPGGKRRYTVRELVLNGFAEPTGEHIWEDVVLHERKKGALVLAAKVCNLVSRRRKVGL